MKIFILVAFFLFVLLMSFFVVKISRNDRAKPLSLWKVYLIFMLGGIWGLHSFYIKRYFWGGITLILSLFLLMLNFNILLTHLYTPVLLYTSVNYTYISQLIFWTLLILLVCDLIALPYHVYKYNNVYYRRHFETDAILNGEDLQVEEFYKELSEFVKHVDADIEVCLDVLNDSDYIIEDEEKDTSFLGGLKRTGKNIITLGKFSRLEQKKDRLRCLMASVSILEEITKELSYKGKRLDNYLNTARKASYRNLYLAKELIFLGKKKVKSKKQFVVKDKKDKMKHLKSFSVEAVGSVSVNSDEFFSSLGNSINNNINRYFSESEVMSKDDVEDAFMFTLVETGVDLVINAATTVYQMNKDTKECLLQAEQSILDTITHINNRINIIMNYKVQLLRKSEILSSLVMCNKAFIQSYEPLRLRIFGEPGVYNYLFVNRKNNQYIQTKEFKEDVHHLMTLCLEYNRINQSK